MVWVGCSSLGGRAYPPMTIFPSGSSITTLGESNAAKFVVVTPPLPKLASGLPSGLRRGMEPQQEGGIVRPPGGLTAADHHDLAVRLEGEIVRIVDEIAERCGQDDA